MKTTKWLVIVLLAVAVGFAGCRKKEKSSVNLIKEFKVGAVTYTITGTTISYTYPKTAVETWTNLPTWPVAPQITLEDAKATINPPASQPQDFEAGATYTVTAENGTSRTYTVKCTRGTLQ
jgi:hypothetical protein